MRMMQAKRRYVNDRFPKRKVLSTKVTTTVGELYTAIHQTKKSNSNHELAKFESPSSKNNNSTTLSPKKTKTTIIVLSPRQAARVEMLKEKFGSTILKAQQKLSNKDSNIYKYVVVEAPKVCSIQEQRRASRESLDKIKPVFDFNENLDSMRDFEELLKPT
ncbi:hypothetical protein E6C27_scaffold255G003590 [Cucumis melo var. makuwa]|uniref:Uncharacterized protein n=1 Tax=Cucumis melo var. makuwa TaxID=1194695 RepID=A0A5A7VFH7_CUCMM|nr:hypothetical protein E6C27_scaffold255G003590 [Cucumis melo var. makuwa]